MEVDDHSALPTLAAIQSAQTPVLRHVPAVARYTWCQVLTRALAQVAHSNDERAWRELLMLPQCILCAPPRGGRRHHKAAAAFTLDRLQRWQAGERLSLWDSRPAPRALGGPAPTADQRKAMAISLGKEGFDKKACAALQSQGLCPPSSEVLRALDALHPHGPAVIANPMHELPLAGEIAPDLVAKCLWAFPLESAPGPSGLRVQHLKDACVPGSSEGFLAQLSLVVNLLAQGRAPQPLAPVLAGAGLVALPKPGGGVRPIAVGEILRRLTGKCLLQLVRADARAHFWPAQVGVAVPGGAETAIHTVRAWTARHAGSPAKVLVKLDFRKAFNCINRQVVLQQAVAHVPSVARWATWCYQQPTHLQFGSHVFHSSSGVQQGDPLGPLLFSAALQPLAAELKAQGLDIAVHYLDDGLLAGDLTAVQAAFALVQQRSASIGLDLNLAKCEVVVLHEHAVPALAAALPDALLRRADGSCKVSRNFEFLGAGIGDNAFIQSHTAERAATAGDLLDSIGELEDPQVALRLLRACGAFARMVHSMRCNPRAPMSWLSTCLMAW